jgi:hypothetical protein
VENKRKLSAKELLTDIRAGMSDLELMQKHQISEKSLKSAFKKLLEMGALKQGEIDARITTSQRIVDTAGKCPVCNTPLSNEAEPCPQCKTYVPQSWAEQLENLKKKEPELMPPPESSQNPRGRLWAVRNQVADTGKQLRDKLAGSSIFGKAVEFIKVSKNAVILGVAGLAMLILVGYLIQARSEQTRQTRSAMTRAFQEAIKTKGEINLSVIKELLDRGANVNTVFDNEAENVSITALLLATSIGHKDLIQLLLARGANPNMGGTYLKTENRSMNGITPLIAAASQGNSEIILMLLRAGANVNAETECGVTALFAASSQKHAEVIPILEAQKPNKSLEVVGKQFRACHEKLVYQCLCEESERNLSEVNRAASMKSGNWWLAAEKADADSKKFIDELVSKNGENPDIKQAYIDLQRLSAGWLMVHGRQLQRIEAGMSKKDVENDLRNNPELRIIEDRMREKCPKYKFPPYTEY